MRIYRIALLFSVSFAFPQAPDSVSARHARDRADVAALSAQIDRARQEAEQTKTADAYLRLALFDHWIVEVGHLQQDKSLGKKAAHEGIEAAEKAVALQPDSSQAHGLLGNLYGDIIPFTFMAGPRYGPKSNGELNRALELNAKNIEAIVGLAIGKIFTPAAFGGSLPKAIQLLNKAVELDPASDTARGWLAHAYEKNHQHIEAVRQITEALRLNPERRWLQHLSRELKPGVRFESKMRESSGGLH